MTRLSVALSTDNIKKAINELKAYRKWVDEKTNILMKRLAEIGLNEAQIKFANAIYAGDNDVAVTVSSTDNGFVVTAKGEAVCFIEFGVGVFYNPTEPYPTERPQGIVGIGEYGNGYGKRYGWTYEGEAGNGGKVLENGRVFTRGNPAYMPMWNARKEILLSVDKIAKEVFET